MPFAVCLDEPISILHSSIKTERSVKTDNGGIISILHSSIKTPCFLIREVTPVRFQFYIVQLRQTAGKMTVIAKYISILHSSIKTGVADLSIPWTKISILHSSIKTDIGAYGRRQLPRFQFYIVQLRHWLQKKHGFRKDHFNST